MNTAFFIITLNPDAESPKALQSALENQGLHPHIFNAVDGRKSTPKLQNNEAINQDQSINYRLTPMGSAEIGAYLSHYRCIRYAYDNDIDKACIFEDDVLIEEDFKKVVNQLLELPEKYEFVRLMELKRCKRKIVSHITQNHYLTRPEKGTLGAQAYLINRNGMKKILDKGMPIWKPFDKLIDHYWELDLPVFSVEPHIIWEIPSETSIKKANYNVSRFNLNTLRWKWNKLLRSINRKIYILKRYSDFHPKKKSTSKMGKTLRKG